MFLQVFKPFAMLFPGVVRLGGGVGWGGGGRDKKVIHIVPCPKHWYSRCFRLLVQHTAQRTWNKTRLHKHPCHSRPCQKHWYLQFFCVFVQHTAQGCGTRKAVTIVHAFGDHAQNIGTYNVFVFLCLADCGLRVNTLNLRNRNTM